MDERPCGETMGKKISRSMMQTRVVERAIGVLGGLVELSNADLSALEDQADR